MSDCKPKSFEIPEIMQYQQNRYPMLFVDKITECIPLDFAKGYKLFSYNEWYFHGYEGSNPNVWNAIQIEAMSQVFLMTFLTSEKAKGHIAMSNKFDNVHFFRKIEIGDKLEIEANLNSFRHGIAKGNVIGFVNSEKACSMECVIIVPEFFGKFQHALPQIETDKTQYLNSITGIEKIKKKNNKLNLTNCGIGWIKNCFENRYPWLFLDKVIDILPGKYVRVFKNFTFNEHFFPSHFPNDPSVPGFIQIESCFQAFLLTILSIEKNIGNDLKDLNLTNIRVKRKIIPGEQLEIFAKLYDLESGHAKGKVQSYVDGEEALSLEISLFIVGKS